MQENKYTRESELWIEITNQKGFLMFGDLSRYQRNEEGVNVGDNEVDIICDNCRHKYRFKKEQVEGKGKIWDWWRWRVFLRGNQVSKGKVAYYANLRVEFFCTHCWAGLPPL